MYFNQNQLAREIDRLSRIHVLVDGDIAVHHDVCQFISTSLCRYGLESDLLGYPRGKPSVYRRVLLSLKTIDLKSYAQDMSTVKSVFIRYRENNSREDSWRAFKRHVSGQISNKWILVILEKLWSVSFQACLQWLTFDERLLLETPLKHDFEADYVSFENVLQHRHLNDADRDVSDLRAILSDWFKDFSFGVDEPEPRFGPGSVAEYRGRHPILFKAREMVPDIRVVELFTRLYGYPNETHTIGSPSRGFPWYVNRIIFRPKNALKKRIISAEPSWLTWYQQAIKRPLYHYVEKHPQIMIWFSNQNRSRELALEGSVACKYATYDFSAASDSITSEMVATLFKDTYIVDALLATRSLEARLPSGKIIPLRKFAPMGSATCFVTMSCILAASCELAIRNALGRHARRSDYVVYGDDCIIISDAADEFVRIARDVLKFDLNISKSYFRDVPYPYRESCGIEAYCGQDVTPVRYSRFQEPLIGVALSDDDFQITQSVSMMNRLALAGYWNTRSVVQECYKHLCNTSKAKFSRKMYSIWNHLLRVDISDYLEGHNGPLAVVVPDGTATNYRNISRNVPPEDPKEPWLQVPTVRVPYYRVRSADVHSEIWNDIPYTLWHIFAQTELPTDQDQPILSGAAGAQSQKWDWVWAEW